MKKILSILTFLCGLLLALQVYAGTDPIGWSVSPAGGFPATVKTGSVYSVTYTISNNLPFSVPLTVRAEHVGGTYSITNGCNKTLAAKDQSGSTCQVYISFQPVGVGTHKVRLILAYHRNRVPLPWTESSGGSNVTVEKIEGHITTPLPGVTYTGTGYPMTFTFVNNGTASVTATAVNVTGFTPSANDCASVISPYSTCAVTGTFTPATDGKTTFGVTYVYSNGGSVSVPLTMETDVKTSSGACHHVNGTVSLPMPFTTYTYSDHVVHYTFTNHCDASTETLGVVALSADNPATLTRSTDTCSNATLAANGSCTVVVSVVPTAVAHDLSVTASVPYNTNTEHALATTSSDVTAPTNTASSHTVTFVNQCDQTVWYEFQNGAGGTKSPDPTPAGARTFPDYQLNQQLTGAAPSTKVLSVTEYINGAIYGRTGCDASTGICATANCPVISGTGTCQQSVGAENPVTILETNMTNAPASDGVYDVSMVNGFNIPGSVRALAPVGADKSQPEIFSCGFAPGAVIVTNPDLGACSWSFSPPTTPSPDTTANYYWVSGGANDACTAATNCGANNYCGMAYASTTEGTTPINRRCGTFLGYWTIADFIGYTAGSQWGTVNLYTLYDMATALGTGPTGVAYGNVVTPTATYAADKAAMYGCIKTDNNSLNSGYTYLTNVCGCFNWDTASGSSAAAKTAQSLPCVPPVGQNSDWISQVFNRILWLKKACPTAYSYQYDDKSSSFQCNQAGKKTSYQITFCPSGKTGRPGT